MFFLVNMQTFGDAVDLEPQQTLFVHGPALPLERLPSPLSFVTKMLMEVKNPLYIGC